MLVAKGEIQPADILLSIAKLTQNCAPYSTLQHGAMRYLPVYAVGGPTMEFGLLDQVRRSYHGLGRYDLHRAEHRAQLIVQSLNLFRYMCALHPFVPSTALPTFKKLPTWLAPDLEVFPDCVYKKKDQLDTAPTELYSLLASGVPCVVKVEVAGNILKISRIGCVISVHRLNLTDVKTALKCVLTCLAVLHAQGFVYRDIH